MKIKELVWQAGPVSRYNNAVNFDYADTPFGQYKAWYRNSKGEYSTWVPTLAEYSQHSTLEEAKQACYAHLCNCIKDAVEE